LGVSDFLNALEINCEPVTEPADPYLVIPGNHGPRWLIPVASRASASVLSAWRPYSVTGQVKWLAVRMAVRAGIVRYLPSVSGLTISRRTALCWFERCGIATHAGEMVVLVGNPSPDRKLIVFLLDDAHRIAAVLKIGVTAGGRLSVLREAEVLRKLERYCWAPNILSVLPDLGAAAQEYVDGTLPDLELRPAYLDLLCRLPPSGGSLKLTDATDAMESRLRPWADEVHRIVPDLLTRCLSCLDLDTAVPTMLVHGDFVPWNIRKTPNSGYVLVDWEWADFAGLPAHDLLHFQFSKDRLFEGKGGDYAAIRKRSVCTEYMKRMDLDPELFPRLAILYLLDRLEAHFKYVDSVAGPYLLRQLESVIDSLGFAS
jgi:hypothetical protein